MYVCAQISIRATATEWRVRKGRCFRKRGTSLSTGAVEAVEVC